MTQFGVMTQRLGKGSLGVNTQKTEVLCQLLDPNAHARKIPSHTDDYESCELIALSALTVSCLLPAALITKFYIVFARPLLISENSLAALS